MRADVKPIFFKYWHEAFISEVKRPEHLPINQLPPLQ